MAVSTEILSRFFFLALVIPNMEGFSALYNISSFLFTLKDVNLNALKTGKEAMVLEYDYWTSTDTKVLESINRSVGQYIRRYTKVKVGMCCNPEQTKKEHCKFNLDWDWMIVKYKTTSVNFITDLKETLKDNNRDCIENIRRGKALGINGNYYLYVLLKE